MNIRIPHVYVEDMIDAIEHIQQYLTNVSEVSFSQNAELQDAVIRRLMIIGEAASKLPDEIKAKSPETPWRTIISFRNVAIHDYANVSMGKVWEIYIQDLPPLFSQLKKLLELLPPAPDPNDVS